MFEIFDSNDCVLCSCSSGGDQWEESVEERIQSLHFSKFNQSMQEPGGTRYVNTQQTDCLNTWTHEDSTWVINTVDGDSRWISTTFLCDEICPGWCWKRLNPQPVSQIRFNSSLQMGIFPAGLKTAVVEPLLKWNNLDVSLLNNYRPASSLPEL